MKKSILFTFFALATTALCSCAANLGVFEKSDGYKSYYDSFGDLRCLYDGGEVSYDVEDSLFNDMTMKELKWEKSEYEVQYQQYLYLILPFESNLDIESISLCVRTVEDVTMKLSAFYFAPGYTRPQKIKYLTSPETETIYDDDDNPIGEQPIIYDDLLPQQSCVEGEMTIHRENWAGFVLGNFHQQGSQDQYLHAKKDSYLYFRIENNSGWNVGQLTPFSFQFMNLMIRAIA